MNIVLLSNHWYPSPRRAGFHHLADAWHAQGHRITFATIGLSAISYARRDYRTKYKGLWQAHNKMQQVKENLCSYVHFTPLHPHTTLVPVLNKLLAPYLEKYSNFNLGELAQHIRDADVIIYESSVALFLVKLCKNLAPKSRHIYRVSDDIAILRSTPSKMLELEREVTPLFDLISVPCAYLKDKFSSEKNVKLQRHGLDKIAFDTLQISPYKEGTRNAIFVGVFNFDKKSVWEMAKHNEDVQFHIIGNVPMEKGLPNVVLHGELPFKETLPYIKFADIGLQPRSYEPAAKSFTDSLKVIQYRYCGLPIVAPDFLNLNRDGVFYYKPHDEFSCSKVIEDALQSGIDMQRASEVHTWDEVATAILAQAE